MKIIFLDFDGVLTSSKAYGVLDSEKMELLWKILEKTGASVVISSSWRLFDVESTKKYLVGEGDEYKNTSFRWLDKVVGVTPRPYVDDFINYDEWNREEEIKRYLESHSEIEDYVILDDMEDEFTDETVLNHLVKTTIKTGMTEDDAREVIRRLRSNAEFN